MKKFYYPTSFELEEEVEKTLLPDVTVTEAILKLNGFCKIAIENKHEYSFLEPYRELKDGVAYTQTSRKKDESRLGFEEPVTTERKTYFLHRNGEGMVYRLQNDFLNLECVLSGEDPEKVNNRIREDNLIRESKGWSRSGCEYKIKD